jgi:hypothetical protein
MIATHRKRLTRFLLFSILLPLAAAGLYGQGRGGGRGGRGNRPPESPKAAAPIDVTGYWVANVTTDWRWRMTVPPKGDYQGLPINDAARKVADTWDPAKDEAAGEQCVNYGAPVIMSVPERIHITWQDDRTLKLETDAGEQTRMFYFGNPQSQGGDWQGVSHASWDMVAGAQGFGIGTVPSGSLKVVTTNFKPGYLRKNGVPYSARGKLTEYYDVIKEPDGSQYLVLSITFEDPTYLTTKYETAVDFKKQADGAGWKPSPCK